MDEKTIVTGDSAGSHGIAQQVQATLGNWVHVLRANPNMLAGAAVILAFATIVIAAPALSRFKPEAIDPFNRFSPPNAEHWFGTDQNGRDVYSRVLYGTRISLLVGVSVAVISSVLGSLTGLLAGYLRLLDGPIMRIMDVIMAIPNILLAIALTALLGAALQNAIIAIAIAEVPRTARVVRSMVLSIREWTYVDAATAIGAPEWRIMLFHVLPGTFAPLIVQSSYVFAHAMLLEASLSFLGAGVPPFIPTWGNMMGEGRTYVQQAIWITFFPGLAIFLAVLSINSVGDGLRDALDPKLRRRQLRGK